MDKIYERTIGRMPAKLAGILVFKEERLRDKTGSRAIVVVGVVKPVRVELDLVLVEVEIGRLVKLTIGNRIIAVCPSSSLDFEVYFLLRTGLYTLNPVFYSAASF